MTSVFTASEAELPNWKVDNLSLSDVTEEDGTSQEGYGLDEEVEHNSGALVVHTANALMASGDLEQPQDQLEVLLEELGRIETQQDKLRDAVKHNKQIVVHPRLDVLEETDSEYDSPKAATPKKKILVSGGLTGFGVAQDLLQIDFSPPEEAPEEFRAVPFYEEPRQVRPGLSGSFGLCDPASKEMHHYLTRLEEQQKLVLELISGKKQQLLDTMGQTGRSASKTGKSRLAKSSRLGDGEKAAVASALGLAPPAGDKMSALGGKMNSLAVGKGALAAKLPLVSLGAPGRAGGQQPRSSPQRHRAQQAANAAAARRAQVQKEDQDAKEDEEMKALFASPMPGTTPSTMHLAGKQKAGGRPRSAEQAAAPEPRAGGGKVTPRVTPRGSPFSVHASPAPVPEEAGPSEEWEATAAATVAAPRGSMFKGLNKGLKKMLKGKQKA